MEGRFDRFETALSSFLESKGYEYYNFFSRLISYETSSTVKEIELTFDKSDESKPFKLANTITIRTPGCSEVVLKLPPEPEGGVHNGDLRDIAFRDQTLMGYIANYEKIKREVEAQENPPWLDFLVENTFPPISVNYGNTLNSKSNAIGCLLDKFSDLDDYILDQTMSFFDSFAYQYNKNNCKVLRNKDKKKPTVYKTDSDLEKIEKSEKEQRKRYLKKKGITENKKIKKTKKTDDLDDNKLSELLSVFSPCNWRKVTLKAVQCLMSGMTIEEGYRELIKGTIGNLTSEGMEILLQGLPADKQDKVRQTIQEQFKDLPAPWEVGYDSGDIEAAYDRTALDNIQQGEALGQTADQLNQLLIDKQNELSPLELGLEYNYEQYSSTIEDKANAQVKNIKQHEDRVLRIEMQLTNASGNFLDAETRLEEAEAEYKKALEEKTSAESIGTAAAQVADARIRYQQAEKQEENIGLDLIKAQENLNFARSQSFSIQTKEQYEEELTQRVAILKNEIAELKIKLDKAQKKVVKDIRANPNRIGFSELGPEEQATVIKQEKEKLFFARAGQSDKIRQGTYGRAVGNVQKELMAAYGQAILENAEVAEIIDGLNKLPGATIIGEFFASFDCPSYRFFTPPIDEFMGTFTIGACGKGKTRPFLLPKLSPIPTDWSLWDALKEAFLYAFKKTMKQVISALILKAIQTLEAGVCQALKFAGNGVEDMIEASLNGGRFPRSFAEIASDVVCGNELNEDEKDKQIEKLFALSGAPKRGN